MKHSGTTISDLEQLVERVQSGGFHPQPESMRELPGTSTAYQEREIGHSEQFLVGVRELLDIPYATTFCPHGKHVDELCMDCEVQ